MSHRSDRRARRAWLPCLLLLACTATLAQEITVTAAQQKALGVTIVVPEPQAKREILGLAAEVMVPNSQLHVVSTPLAGLVDTVLVAVNETVKRGQLLARMQSSALAEAQRAYLQATTQRELARANLDRDQKLAAEGLIAESRLLSTKASHVEAAALFAERRHALKLAGMSDKSIAATQSGSTISSTVSIVAPVDGVVIAQMAQAGQRLEAYTPIYKVAQLDPLWLEVQVPLARAAGVREGAPVRVPSVEASGRIISVGHSVTPSSQTVMLRALISTNASRLRPGQYVEAAVSVADGAVHQWRVPNAALLRLEGKVLVLARTTKGFRAVPVTPIQEGPTTSVVTGDLDGVTGIALGGISSLKAQFIGIGR